MLTEEVTGGLIEGYFDNITYCCKPVTDPQVRRTYFVIDLFTVL